MTRARLLELITTVGAIALLSSCLDGEAGNPHARAIRPPEGEAFFSPKAPRAPAYRKELDYLRTSGQLSAKEHGLLEKSIDRAHQSFGVPRSLLWCVLFQESRLDRYKNAASRKGARGIGQFTPAALDEINTETNQYDPETKAKLLALLGQKAMPLDFSLVPPNVRASTLNDRRRRKLPEQAPASYFRADTAVAATAAYLNNRYRQLVRALDPMDVEYDPDAVWLMAAAAYNKGPRTIYVLLSRQRMFGGKDKLQGILSSTKLSYALLTHPEVLDIAFRGIWSSRARKANVEELVRNMGAIRACATTEDPSA